MKKIGILDLSAPTSSSWWSHLIDVPEKKQYVSITPQAISVWCRQMGHRVHYATYYGVGDPKDKLPDDLDVVFISGHTCTAPLAYALAQLYRREGTCTVLGGPHAKSFPADALRYFDLVVLECDSRLVSDIIDGHYDNHQIISSLKPFEDVPTLKERLPEIKASVFWRGRPSGLSLIPMLASMGCPYTCNFCTDWNTRYRPLSSDRLAEDLAFASEHLPGVKLIFYDPNFGIRFDETLTVFETVPSGRRSPYALETSLSNLRRPERLERLRATNCFAVAPGIESWNNYSNKTGVGNAAGRDKLERVVQHLHTLKEYVPYIGANFILGLDTDSGDEPFELTKEFLLRTCFIYPTLNTPMAFGGTPLYDDLLAGGRILRAMPFLFYTAPYLTLRLKNYDPISYLTRMVELYSLVSNELFRMGLAEKGPWGAKVVNAYRTFRYRGSRSVLSDTLKALETDPQMRAFHLGTSPDLPEFYVSRYNRQMGRYRELMPIDQSQPILEPAPEPRWQKISQLRDSAHQEGMTLPLC